MSTQELFAELNKNILQRVADGALAFNSIYDIYSKRLNDIKNGIKNGHLEHDKLKSIAENVEPRPSRTGKKANRPVRKVLQESNLNNQQVITDCNNLKPVVKLEKLSDEFIGSVTEKGLQQNVVIKQEKTSLNCMPPPTELPKRTRARKNTVNESSNSGRRSPRFTECDSDIMMEKDNISVITLSDSSVTEEDEPRQSNAKVKNQRKKKDNENGPKSKPLSKIKKEVDSDHSETESKSKTDETVRVTRTKARAKAKEQDKVEPGKNNPKSENSTEFLKPEEVIRSTRSKMRAKEQKELNEKIKRSEENNKRLRSPSSENDIKTNEKQKSKPRKPKRVKSNEKTNENSVQEDNDDTNKENASKMDQTYNVNNQTYNVQNLNKVTVSDNEKINPAIENKTVALSKANETVVLNKNDATVILQKATVLQNPTNPDDLITDDESIVEDTPPVPKQQIKTNKKPVKTVKQIFSPFSNSPVKKRVEAFEKLGAEQNGSEIPVRMTRTKKKAIEKEEAEKSNQPVEENKATKEKSKIATPAASHRFMPKTFNSVSKIQNNISQKNFNESLISTKSASALKISQNEFRERELKRREKEEEALRKREAILQAQIEEKRRKREEKQMKAQQQREALEKDKQKMHEEAERLKEEKRKQLLAEKEEKQQRLREEVNRKRLLALQKAKEKKKEEEIWKKMEEEEQRRKLEEEKKKLEWRPINASKMNNNDDQPIYLAQEAPLLPTDDCYDSDDPRSNYKKNVPYWATKTELHKMCRAMCFAGDQIKNSFFRCKAQSPDLRKIFYKIEPSKLKRTSSGIWHEPPRYTQLLQRPNEV